MLCMIGTTIGTSLDHFLRPGRKFVLTSLKLSLVDDRLKICSRLSVGIWMIVGGWVRDTQIP